MGWLSYNIYSSPKAECDNCYNQNLERNGVKGQDKVLCSCMKGNVYYAVIERTWEDNTPREVWAAVARTYYNPKAKHDNFAIKEIDETMGPFDYDMPEKYLDMLTETHSQFAKEWREKCRLNIEKKKKLKSVKIGQFISFVSTFDTSSGVKKGEEIVLLKRKWGKRYIWYRGGYKWSEKLIPNNFEILD